MEKIFLLDSTLREGAQSSGVAFSIEDKLDILRTLDAFGIDYIEGGNPASNPKDAAFFERAKDERLRHARLCAFGSTRKKDRAVGADAGVAALLASGTPVGVLGGKAWDVQARAVLGTSLEENLRMIFDTVAFFKDRGLEVIFDAEHFFDGYLSIIASALVSVLAAIRAGEDSVCLCDTNGGRIVEEIETVTRAARRALDVPVGIHCHNDSGLADAGALAAVAAGARQVQGTFIGIGERCGNTNLCLTIANLQLKCGYTCLPDERLLDLRDTARKIADRLNLRLSPVMPYVGAAAFAHKGGMHIDALDKQADAFEHIDPALVGNARKVLTSEMAGRATVLKKIHDIAPELSKDSGPTKLVMETLKQMEFEGYQFEAAESSFELMVRRTLGLHRSFFELEHYRIVGEQPFVRESSGASAQIKVPVDGRTELTAAAGPGPMHGLDTARRKAVAVGYPQLKKVRLTDYKVRVMEPKDGAATKVRVLIESTDGQNIWSTVGVSGDIIEASWMALRDSIEYKLTLDAGKYN